MVATLLSPAQLRQHVETDLADDTLQQILDAHEDEMVRRYGAHASASELLPGGGEWLVLERPAAAIVSVTETVSGVSTVLAADDYRLWGEQRLERLTDGTNPRLYWGDRVQVTYTPVDQTAQRRLVLVQLSKLSVQYSGLRSSSTGGDASETTLDYPAERERLLRSLAPRGGVWFA